MFKKIIQNIYIRKGLILLLNMVSVINKFIPKDDSIILFYDGASARLRDNSEALCSYLLEHKYDEKYKLILCIPNNKSQNINGIQNIGALRGIFTFMRAKYVFFSFGDMRIRPAKSQTVVNLWHGIAFKKIGKLCNDKYYQKEKLDSFTYVLATSEWFKPYVALEFGVTEDKVLINGNCRCDYFNMKSYTIDKFVDNPEKYKKIFLWMPTFRTSSDGRFNDSKNFRSETGLPLIDSITKLQCLNKFCEENYFFIVVKAHNETKLPEQKKFNNILFLTDFDLLSQGIHIYEFVKDFDALITDYSSIFIDFLLLDKPICFTVDDIENYKNGRGFIIDDPTKYMPGKKIRLYDEFLDFLLETLDETDYYAEKRKEINNLFNKYKNNHCRRLLESLNIKN